MEEKKNIEYKFRVTKSESDVLEKRFADAQVKSMTEPERNAVWLCRR